MTAEELAIELELQSSQMEYGYAVSDWKLLSDAATMLRQQQVEIEALKETRCVACGWNPNLIGGKK